MENQVFMKAKSKEDYMNMVAKLILHVREMGWYNVYSLTSLDGADSNYEICFTILYGL